MTSCCRRRGLSDQGRVRCVSTRGSGLFSSKCWTRITTSQKQRSIVYMSCSTRVAWTIENAIYTLRTQPGDYALIECERAESLSPLDLASTNSNAPIRESTPFSIEVPVESLQFSYHAGPYSTLTRASGCKKTPPIRSKAGHLRPSRARA